MDSIFQCSPHSENFRCSFSPACREVTRKTPGWASHLSCPLTGVRLERLDIVHWGQERRPGAQSQVTEQPLERGSGRPGRCLDPWGDLCGPPFPETDARLCLSLRPPVLSGGQGQSRGRLTSKAEQHPWNSSPASLEVALPAVGAAAPPSRPSTKGLKVHTVLPINTPSRL